MEGQKPAAEPLDPDAGEPASIDVAGDEVSTVEPRLVDAPGRND
jgi:hypothetical protein